MRRVILCSMIGVLVAAAPAAARNDVKDFDVKAARETSVGQQKLLDIPFYMSGEKHPPVARKLGSYPSNKKTNAFNKTDELACQVAFLSAVISLQTRASRLGADAVVNIKSRAATGELDSATQFRCAVGNVVAGVSLEGDMVKFK